LNIIVLMVMSKVLAADRSRWMGDDTISIFDAF